VNVIFAWLRLDVRRRWQSLAILALLIALSAGTVMTAVAAARRAASAQSRFYAHTLPATTAILANTPGFDWSKIRALPEVAALTTFVVDYSYSIDGVSGSALQFPPADAQTMRTIEKPIVYAGRVFNPSRADEVVVSRQFVATYGKGVGSTLTAHLGSVQQLADGIDSGAGVPMKGPTLHLHVVGVVSSPWFEDATGSPGFVLLSPGVEAHYPANVIGDQTNPRNSTPINALVRLRDGGADLDRLRRDFARVTGRSDIEFFDLPAQARAQQHQILFEARTLLAFAIAVLVAAMFLVGQAIARYAAASTAELQTLRALGMTPRQSIATAMAGPMVAGLIGGLTGAVAAWFASEWTPIGSASLIEPTPGRNVDWTVLAPGVLAVLLLVAAGAAGASWLALSSARRQPSDRRSTVAVAAARIGMRTPVVLGARFALEPGRGRTAVPVRPALIGAVIGVTGILGAFTFSHGVSDAAARPERFGQTFQVGAFVGFNNQNFLPSQGPLLSALAKNPAVTGIDDARIAVATGPGGRGSVSLYEYAPVSGKAVPTVLLSGRMPESADEVVLAPVSLAALHAHVGGRVTLTGDRGARTLTVTGSGFVPIGSHNDYSDGGWLTPAGYSSMFTIFKFRVVLVTLAPPARGPHAGATLTHQLGRADPALAGVSFGPTELPQAIAQLNEVRVLPIALGVFLALLAIGAVGHALATAVRRRSHDLAVLRALGMTRWQCRWVVVTQASVLALIGLIFGMPLGLAIGRTIWRAVAVSTPVEYVPPTAVSALLLLGPCALVIANMLAAWPSHRAARLKVAHVLRAE
jgi:ABC-type lipoprotein release transport system permease subunit